MREIPVLAKRKRMPVLCSVGMKHPSVSFSLFWGVSWWRKNHHGKFRSKYDFNWSSKLADSDLFIRLLLIDALQREAPSPPLQEQDCRGNMFYAWCQAGVRAEWWWFSAITRSVSTPLRPHRLVLREATRLFWNQVSPVELSWSWNRTNSNFRVFTI